MKSKIFTRGIVCIHPSLSGYVDQILDNPNIYGLKNIDVMSLEFHEDDEIIKQCEKALRNQHNHLYFVPIWSDTRTSLKQAGLKYDMVYLDGDSPMLESCNADQTTGRKYRIKKDQKLQDVLL